MPLLASMNSAASLSDMLLPLRLRADSISQRMPRLMRRSARTSTGIWYVEPPTRFGLTSMSGIALRSACSSTSTPARPACDSQRLRASSRIRCARWRLPPYISLFVNWLRVSAVPLSCSAYLSLRAMVGRRGIYLGLGRRLRAVLAAALPTISHAGRIERAADDVVLHRREVLHAAATHQHHRVLLQVMADAGDVRGDLHAIRQAHAGDLPKRRVRLLRSARHHLEAHAAPLRRATSLARGLLEGVQRPAQRRGLDLLDGRLATLADQLADGWQREPRVRIALNVSAVVAPMAPTAIPMATSRGSRYVGHSGD